MDAIALAIAGKTTVAEEAQVVNLLSLMGSIPLTFSLLMTQGQPSAMSPISRRPLHKIDIAENGEMAVESLCQAIIILCLWMQMPVMDGSPQASLVGGKRGNKTHLSLP